MGEARDETAEELVSSILDLLAKLDDAGLSPSDRQIVRSMQWLGGQLRVSVTARKDVAA
jgi:hypothetical protein